MIDPTEQPLTQATGEHLGEVRSALLNLHTAILHVERAAYERDNGRVLPGELLRLLTQHEFFGWFRPLSEIVVQIDELLDTAEESSEADAKSLLREVRSLLIPAEEGEEFSIRYREILQQDPDVILAHASVAKLLRADPPAPTA